MEQIIQLASDDDITSIRFRLEWSDARRVLLVVPRKNKVLRSLVNQKILARAADRLNIQLALVTLDMKTRDAAKQAGLKTYAAEWIARKRGFISLAADKAAPETTEAPRLRLVETPSPRRVRIQNKKLVLVVGSGRVGCLQQIIALILAGILALALVLTVLALAPTATVTLTPQVEVITATLSLTADPSPDVSAVDAENSIIPARAVQTELTLFTEVKTLDTEAAPVDFATGSVVFINRTQDEQFIPISATLRTSSGVPIEFITTQTATVPAGTGATAAATIIAVEPGPRGNAPAGQINRFANPTQGLLVRVINESAVSGGSMRQAGVVKDDDKDRVRAKLRQLIQQEGYEQMLAQLDEGEFIPPESLQTIELAITYNHFSGDVTDALGAEMHAVVRGTAVGNYYANQLAYYALLEQVPADAALLPKGLQFSAGGIEAVDDRSVTFSVMAEGVAVSDIDENLARQSITFKPIGEAQKWLSDNQPIISVPGVDVSPNWLGRLPAFPSRIEVVVVDVLPLIFGEEE